MTRCSRLFVLLVLLLMPAIVLAAPPRSMTVAVDATEISRRLLRSRIEMAVKPGELALWYPKWIPGTHAPSGPIQNLGGMRFRTADGKAIAWRRDEVELHRLTCDIPAGVDRLIIELDYITNQPSVNSVGIDSFGNSQLGIINWNTCLLYPDGIGMEQLQVAVSVKLPEGWGYGTALPVKSGESATITFEPRPLVEVIDSPLLCGEHLRSIPLTPDFGELSRVAGLNWPEVWLHVASEAESAVQMDEKVKAEFEKMVAEAAALFGAAHFESYHFLLGLSDSLPGTGLEHHGSSLNVVKERGLVDDKERKGRLAYLLPHEFVHSWCGKYRRPAGMLTGGYHEPDRTAMLWVYEGLTQYLGEVLAVRSGLISQEEHMERLAAKISRLKRQTGRNWRPLHDTAVASWLLRGGSPNWHGMRRGQDYYDEGLLIWLEVDAIIRDRTGGRRSLDDFCRRFFGEIAGAENQRVVPFTFEQLVADLKAVADYDWANLLTRRISETPDQMPLEFVTLAGYRLEYATAVPKYIEEREKEHSSVDASDSLGAGFDKEGKITFVSAMTPADRAGLAPEMQVVGVNGSKYTPQRMKDAIAGSVTRGEIELLLLDGERFRTVKLPYAEGAKYLTLVPEKNRRDLLSDMLKPAGK